jgi:hypothetical protein
MKQSSSWETNSRSATNEISQLLWNLKVHYRVTWALHWSLPWTTWIQSTPSHFISLTSKKVKVKLSLCFFFNWSPRCEGVLGKWRYRSTHSLTSAIDGGELSASRPGRFIPRGRVPDTHWIGGWVDRRAGLDAMVKRKIPSLFRDSNHRLSSP